MIPLNDVIKENSQRIVLNLIRIHKQLSGAELARLTGLQPSTIVYILRTLADKNLIFSSGVGTSTQRGGKKPTLWEIAPKEFFLMGMELLPNKIRAILSSINNDILIQEEIQIKEGIATKNIIQTIKNTFNKILHTHKIKKENIIGLGVALPGLIDKVAGKVFYSSRLNLEDFLLSKPLEESIGIPVFIGNDANAGALGIQWYPTNGDENFDNKVFVIYNQEAKNLGFGIIINNSLYHGTTGTAGEVFTLLPSTKQLIGETKKKINNGKILLRPDTSDLNEISEFEKSGCPASNYVLTKICEHISQEITKTIGFLNPEIIVLGGDLPETERLINEKIVPNIENEMSSILHKGYLIPEIKSSAYKKYAVAMGANALVLSEWLNPER